jgi:hypothetical protein
MEWISKYRFKTLEELEPYRVIGCSDYYNCGSNNFVSFMFKFCGLPLSNFRYSEIRFNEEQFKNGDCEIIMEDFGITYEMVVDVVRERKRKLSKIN